MLISGDKYKVMRGKYKGTVRKRPGKKRFELVTTMTGYDIPFQVSGRSRASVLKMVRRKLRKGERIVSLKSA